MTSRLLNPQFQFLHNYSFSLIAFNEHIEHVPNISQVDGHRVGRTEVESSFCSASCWQWIKYNGGRGVCLWGKWTLARKCVSRDLVLGMSCTLESQISALLNTTILTGTAVQASLWKGSVTHTCKSATSVWQLFAPDEISKWRFCLQKPCKSLWPPSCINTNPHIKMTHSQLLKTPGCNFPKQN